MTILTLNDFLKEYSWLAHSVKDVFTQENTTKLVVQIETLMRKYANTVYNPKSVITLADYSGVGVYLTDYMPMIGPYTQAQLYLVHNKTHQSGLFDLNSGLLKQPQTLVQDIVRLAA